LIVARGACYLPNVLMEREPMRRSKAMKWHATVLAVGLGAVAACSSKGGHDDSVAQSVLTGDVSFTLSAPRGIPALSAVVLASSSVKVGSFAQIARPPSGVAPVVAMGTAGVRVDPDAAMDDVWSRGPVTLADRVHVYGAVNAATVNRGNGTVIDKPIDRTPLLDPANKIAWKTRFPTGTPTNVNLEPNKTRTISPGLYGSVRLASGATLTMNAGTYHLDSLDVEPQATVKLVQDSGPVIIYVATSIIYRGSFVATNGAPPDLLLAAVASGTVFVEAPFNGALIAPYGSIVVRFGVHNGFFAAKDVSVDANATVRYRAPNALLPAAGLPLQDCANQVAVRTDLTGKAREIAYQADIARFCSMPGTSECRRTIVARTNVDYATIATSLIVGAVTPATYLAVTRDRARKERAAEDDPTLANLICKGPDGDGDLVPDSRDACPNTPPLTATLDNGCTDTTVPDAPSPEDVGDLFDGGSVMIDPRCANASVLPDAVAGAFYYPGIPERGTYIIAGRVTNQPKGCAVWYVFDIEEYKQSGTVRKYQVAFAQTEETAALVGLSQPVPRGFIQFNPFPTDPGTRGFLGSAGGKVGVRFRVRTMNATGMRSDWSAWKVTTLDDCHQLGFQCAG
jgi:hypothetical protein